MPVAKHPTRREFYVYTLQIRRVPFYVGIGRATRASDRVRYVRYMMARRVEGKTVRWNLSASVIALLLSVGLTPVVSYRKRGITRAAALAYEKQLIGRLAAAGVILANKQHNPKWPKSAEAVALTVVTAIGEAGA
jgi:hypothetical protein